MTGNPPKSIIGFNERRIAMIKSGAKKGLLSC